MEERGPGLDGLRLAPFAEFENTPEVEYLAGLEDRSECGPILVDYIVTHYRKQANQKGADGQAPGLSVLDNNDYAGNLLRYATSDRAVAGSVAQELQNLTPEDQAVLRPQVLKGLVLEIIPYRYEGTNLIARTITACLLSRLLERPQELEGLMEFLSDAVNKAADTDINVLVSDTLQYVTRQCAEQQLIAGQQDFEEADTEVLAPTPDAPHQEDVRLMIGELATFLMAQPFDKDETIANASVNPAMRYRQITETVDFNEYPVIVELSKEELSSNISTFYVLYRQAFDALSPADPGYIHDSVKTIIEEYLVNCLDLFERNYVEITRTAAIHIKRFSELYALNSYNDLEFRDRAIRSMDDSAGVEDLANLDDLYTRYRNRYLNRAVARYAEDVLNRRGITIDTVVPPGLGKVEYSQLEGSVKFADIQQLSDALVELLEYDPPFEAVIPGVGKDEVAAYQRKTGIDDHNYSVRQAIPEELELWAQRMEEPGATEIFQYMNSHETFAIYIDKVKDGFRVNFAGNHSQALLIGLAVAAKKQVDFGPRASVTYYSKLPGMIDILGKTVIDPHSLRNELFEVVTEFGTRDKIAQHLQAILGKKSALSRRVLQELFEPQTNTDEPGSLKRQQGLQVESSGFTADDQNHTLLHGQRFEVVASSDTEANWQIEELATLAGSIIVGFSSLSPKAAEIIAATEILSRHVHDFQRRVVDGWVVDIDGSEIRYQRPGI